MGGVNGISEVLELLEPFYLTKIAPIAFFFNK
jgi:hypothetical protein